MYKIPDLHQSNIKCLEFEVRTSIYDNMTQVRKSISANRSGKLLKLMSI